MWNYINYITFLLGFIFGSLGVLIYRKFFCHKKRGKVEKTEDIQEKLSDEELKKQEEEEEKQELEKRVKRELKHLVNEEMREEYQNCTKCQYWMSSYSTNDNFFNKYRNDYCVEHQQKWIELYKERWNKWKKEGKIE